LQLTGEGQMLPFESFDDTHASAESEVVALVPALRVFAWSYCTDPHDADELVKESLTNALTLARQGRPNISDKTWLFAIMRNSRRALDKNPADVEHMVTSADLGQWQQSSEPRQGLISAIRALPLAQREVVMLKGVLGFSHAETAEICCCEISAVQSRYSDALSKLPE